MSEATQKLREELIEQIVELEGEYASDIKYLLRYGCKGYYNMSNDEITSIYEELFIVDFCEEDLVNIPEYKLFQEWKKALIEDIIVEK